MSAYLTPPEAADYLKLPNVGALYDLLYKRRKAGRPITTRRLGGRLRFKPEDLDAAMTVERERPRLRRAG